MKKLLFLIILIAIVVGGAPFVDGYYFKQDYLKLVANMNALPQGPKIKVVSYNMGWLKSHVKLEISQSPGAGDPMLGNLNFSQMTVDQTIDHGPVIFGDGSMAFAVAKIVSSIHLPAPVEQILLGNANTSGVMTVASTVKFDGEWIDVINTPVFKVKQEGIGELTFHGINGEIKAKVVSNQLQLISGQITVGELDVVASAGKGGKTYTIKTKPMTLDTDAVLDVLGLWNGTTKLSIPSVAVKADGHPMLTVSNFDVMSNMSVNGGKYYTVGEKISVGKVNVPGVVIPEVGPATFKINLKNMNAKSLVDFLVYTNSLPATEMTLTDEQQKKLTDMALQLIDSSTSIVWHFSGDTSDGAFKSDIVASLKQGLPKPATIPGIMQNGVIKFDAKIAVPLATKIVEGHVKDLMKGQDKKQPSSQDGNSGSQWGQSSASPEAGLQATMQEQGILENTGAQGASNNSPDAKSMLSAWVAQGYLKQVGNDYVISVTYENGIFMVNGRPMQAFNQ